MVADSVRIFMIEKKEAVDSIEEICRIPGVDMIQFGPSDYSMSCGHNAAEPETPWSSGVRNCRICFSIPCINRFW